MALTKLARRKRIHHRIRKKMEGSNARPRLSVYRSNKQIYCQLIDDNNGITLAAAASTDESVAGANKTEIATKVGELIGSRAKAMNISEVVFDRGGYLFHGRVKALAEGARSTGLKF
ncbi:MAG TPA: 50S ribosomal protein L18 [Saprospiraceae bacterium]|nr:50S ribosomal protein L18 [Saprospiraceae bacterium]